jgi:hypothetical protein
MEVVPFFHTRNLGMPVIQAYALYTYHYKRFFEVHTCCLFWGSKWSNGRHASLSRHVPNGVIHLRVLPLLPNPREAKASVEWGAVALPILVYFYRVVWLKRQREEAMAVWLTERHIFISRCNTRAYLLVISEWQEPTHLGSSREALSLIG